MKYTVHFQPNDVAVSVAEGTNLLDAALAADVHINASCGGQGTCGKCRVRVHKGSVSSEETPHLTQEERDRGFCLACRSVVMADCTVEIPGETRPSRGRVPKTVEMGKADRRAEVPDAGSVLEGWQSAPLAVKVAMTLPPPTMEDNVSDAARLLTALRRQYGMKDVSMEIRCIRELPRVFRENDWNITATLLSDTGQIIRRPDREFRGRWHVVRCEGKDTAQRNFGIALDVGTTTVCGQLIQLDTGEVLAESALYNGQIDYGADVITRIVYAQKADGAQRLQDAVVATVNGVVDALIKEAGVSKAHVSTVVSAGNTTMTHLFLGLETRYIREAPYVPVTSYALIEKAIDVGIDLPGCVPLCSFPAVASYVGGDIVSGVLASGMFQREELTLLMDIGTNGEIVLGNKDWLACAACSMGPAFEGGGIQHGMRADEGAIEGFHVNHDTWEPMVVTVGKKPPKGICGSGLISVLAELLSAGIIGPNGKFVQESHCDRIRKGRFGYEYVLARAEHTAIDGDIVITEVDIENLIRAKGALYAGCLTLLDSLSLTFDDLDRVVIAGAFGRYINLEKGQRIGLFPDIAVDTFRFLGNGSLMGARLASLDRYLFHDMNRIRNMMTNVELSDNASFMDKYMASLFLPHTDARLFPNVSKRLRHTRQEGDVPGGGKRP